MTSIAAGDAAETVVRNERAWVLATLVRVTGSIDAAEDALQEAIVRALQVWPRDGVPPNPRAWLLLTARRRAIDEFRREVRRPGLEGEAMYLLPPEEPEPPAAVADDLLKLLFTCCHPTLSLDAQIALALRTIGGLSTAEVGRALLVSEPTMAKRITRAKQKIAQARIPFRVPSAEHLPERLSGVAGTIYLIFNEGYAAGGGTDVVRASLTGEAIRLSRLLTELMPDEAVVLGLLALLLLQDSRQSARTDLDGRVVLLRHQDRSRWDAAAIREGIELVGRALRRSPDRPEPYTVQATIAACHALAPSYEATSWDAVVSWYDVLLTVHDTPIVRLNRAAAVGERDGPAAGLALINELNGLDGYAWWHASRADFLARLGDDVAALDAYSRALTAGLSEPYRVYVQGRIATLRGSDTEPSGR